MTDDPIVIASVARTPLCTFQGRLVRLSALKLGAVAIQAAVERCGMPAQAVEEVLMGCVLPAGIGPPFGRQCAWRDSARHHRVSRDARAGAAVVHTQRLRWVPCARRCCERGGRRNHVDLWEINEAFAVVTMAAMRELGLPHNRVNANGGACGLGHPIGASGARILVTLIGALRARGARRGVAPLCIGGGEATAMAIELA
jgi:acetyl-CoA acetyltransferase